MSRPFKIYTKTGDDGTTHLIGGRTSKSDAQIEAIGTIDEINAHIGLVRASDVDESTQTILKRIQQELFAIGAELALGPKPGREVPRINANHITQIEKDIDATTDNLPELKHFVLPGGSLAAAHLHLARAVCRRGERRVVALQEVPSEVRQYLNRLSDLLFVLARAQNLRSHISETLWQQNA